MQALGKETIIIRTADVKIPSDFIRTEYILFEPDNRKKFSTDVKMFIKSLDEQEEHYSQLADTLAANPIYSADYLMRSYLIRPQKKTKNKLKAIVNQNSLPSFVKERIKQLLKTKP